MMEELTFQSLPFPFPESQREELVHYRQLAVAKEREMAHRRQLKLQQLKEYVFRRLREMEKPKQTTRRTELNNLDAGSDPRLVDEPAATSTALSHLTQQSVEQTNEERDSDRVLHSPSTCGAMPTVSTASSFQFAVVDTSQHSSLPSPYSAGSISVEKSSPPALHPLSATSMKKPSPPPSPPPHSPGPSFSTSKYDPASPGSLPTSKASPCAFTTQNSPPLSPPTAKSSPLSPPISCLSTARHSPSSSPPPVSITRHNPPPYSSLHHTLSPSYKPRLLQFGERQMETSHQLTTPTTTTYTSPIKSPPFSASPVLSTRNRERHVKLAAVWSNGGTTVQQSPMEGMLSSNTGRHSMTSASNTKKNMKAKLAALAKGFLTRRLLGAEKIQEIVTTIRDAESVLQSLDNPTQPQDFDLQQRVISQLLAAKLHIYDIFFHQPAEQRMSYITHSRLLRRERTFKKILGSQDDGHMKGGRLSSATIKSLQRKKTTDRSSTLATVTNRPAPVVTESHTRPRSQTIPPATARQSVVSKAAHKPTGQALQEKPYSNQRTAQIAAKPARKALSGRVRGGGGGGGVTKVTVTTRSSSKATAATPSSTIHTRIPLPSSSNKKTASSKPVTRKTVENRMTRTYTKKK